MGVRRRRALARRRRVPTGSDQSHEDGANRGVHPNVGVYFLHFLGVYLLHFLGVDLYPNFGVYVHPNLGVYLHANLGEDKHLIFEDKYLNFEDKYIK